MSRTILRSNVSHDLTSWSTHELGLRYDTLSAFSAPLGRHDIDTFLRLSGKVLCGCGDEFPCAVDSSHAIDTELGSRAY